MIKPPTKIFILSGACILAFLLFVLNHFGFLSVSILIFLVLFSLTIIFSFYSYKVLVAALIVSLPWSINVPLFSSLTLIFPSELFTGLLTMIFFFRLFFIEKVFPFSNAFLKHPLTIFVFLYVAGILLSAVFSTMPLVSIKSLLVRGCYISVFYFMMNLILKTASSNKQAPFLMYGFSLLFVIVYAILKHISFGLVKGNSAASVIPFYNDHTMYSAAIAFVIPAFTASFFFGRTLNMNRTIRSGIFVALLFLFAGLFLSYCRAAWISVIVALLFFLMLTLKFRLQTFIYLLIGITAYVSFSYPKLIETFRQNKIDSNVKNAGFYEQTGSITNITSDVSNAERLNRWSCAVRMFLDKPFTGFGIGTYQFQYLPYQRKEEMTHISVTTPYNIQQGHGGSCHSEYLVTLSESGILPLLAFIGLLLGSLFASLKLFSKSQDKKTRITAGFIMLGLITYFTHGLFNNFLENDKLAFLFWSSLSILATLDSSSERT